MFQKKRRRLLAYVPSEDHEKRLEQLRSLALALTSNNMEFSNELSYRPGMAPRSANQAALEIGGMQVQLKTMFSIFVLGLVDGKSSALCLFQVLSKEDTETLQYTRTMFKRGEFPPVTVTFDSFEGYLGSVC